MNRWKEQQQTVLDTALRMLELGLVSGSSGNVSVRLPREEDREILAITPTSRAYGTLRVHDIVIIDFEGNVVEGELAPSVESSLHAGIYRERRDINAIIHTHSVHASAAAVTGHDIPPILDDQVIYLGGSIRCAQYAPVGSLKLAQAAIEALGKHCALLLKNHGSVGCGADAAEALENCLLLEKTAQVYLLALAAGSMTKLDNTAVAADLVYYQTRHPVA